MVKMHLGNETTKANGTCYSTGETLSAQRTVTGCGSGPACGKRCWEGWRNKERTADLTLALTAALTEGFDSGSCSLAGAKHLNQLRRAGRPKTVNLAAAPYCTTELCALDERRWTTFRQSERSFFGNHQSLTHLRASSSPTGACRIRSMTDDSV